MPQIADWITRGVTAAGAGDEDALTTIRAEVAELMSAYPAPGLVADAS